MSCWSSRNRSPTVISISGPLSARASMYLSFIPRLGQRVGMCAAVETSRRWHIRGPVQNAHIQLVHAQSNQKHRPESKDVPEADDVQRVQQKHYTECDEDHRTDRHPVTSAVLQRKNARKL